MSDLNRRQFLKSAMVNLVRAAGSVTLVSMAIAKARAGEVPAEADGRNDDAARGRREEDLQQPPNLQQRADELAAGFGADPNSTPDGQATVELAQFLNGGRRRGGRWRNAPWRNGVWRNGVAWRGSPFLNAGWPNAIFRNSPWNNGIWVNGGWGNW
jgi:hypothetical protein